MAKVIGVLASLDDDPLVAQLVRRCQAQADVVAEAAVIGGITERHISRYDVFIDRISHRVPHLRLCLKAAALAGVRVINDPFSCSADDKLAALALAARLGLATKRAVLLPQKSYPGHVDTSRELRNLEYPLRWEQLVRYVGLPAVLRRADYLGDFGTPTLVADWQAMMAAYDRTGTQVVMLQQWAEPDWYLRALCVGSQVELWQHDPWQQRDLPPEPEAPLPAAITVAARAAARAITGALGYQINCVELAVHDGEVHAVDVANPFVELSRLRDVSPAMFDRLVDALLSLAVSLARNPGARTCGRHDLARLSEQ